MARVGETFIVLAESAITSEPGEGALDNPSVGQELETGGVVGAFDDFESPAGEGLGPFDKLAGIAAVGPNQGEPWEPSLELLEDQLGSVSILKARLVNDHRQDQAEGVDDEMAFASVDLLCGIVPARPPFSVVLTD